MVPGNMLLVAVNKIVARLVLDTKGYMLPRYRQHVAGNMLPGNMLPGVNAALETQLGRIEANVTRVPIQRSKVQSSRSLGRLMLRSKKCVIYSEWEILRTSDLVHI